MVEPGDLRSSPAPSELELWGGNMYVSLCSSLFMFHGHHKRKRLNILAQMKSIYLIILHCFQRHVSKILGQIVQWRYITTSCTMLRPDVSSLIHRETVKYLAQYVIRVFEQVWFVIRKRSAAQTDLEICDIFFSFQRFY